MFNHSAFALLLFVGLILNCSYSQSAASSRKSNANGNNIFNFLLGLYKMNPLKNSPVFQSFSNNLLMGHAKKDHVVLNFESGENVKVNEQVKMNLNEIERTIHTRNKKPAKHFEKPAYDLDDVGTENFKSDLVIDDQILSKEEIQRNLDNHNIVEDFSSLFEHIGSRENGNEMPVTKLLPVNDTIIRYSQVSNQNEAVFGLKDTNSTMSNSKYVNHIGTAEIRHRNPEEVPMDNLEEQVGDVIVL